MSRTKKLVILGGIVLVTLGAVLYFTPPHPVSAYNTKLIIQAWSQTSYSFGSTKWLFFYSPNWNDAPRSLKTHFQFPAFAPANVPLNQPILLLAFSAVDGSGTESSTGLGATVGASYTWNGVVMTVSEVNSASVVLSFKPLS
jgi:hypothetical protein